MSSIIELVKLFSVLDDTLYYTPNLKYCKGYPKFVVDYIKNVQPILKGGTEMCRWCFPVAPMNTEEPEKDTDLSKENYYFKDSIGDFANLRLVWKAGKWYEKKGIFLKKLVPVSDPASWLVNEIMTMDDEDNREENMKNSDYPKFQKALEALKRMIGKYKS